MNLREKQISQLRQSYFDVLIIGGGINGAVCAASLSKQGVSVALVEKNDFASFSSQESSNLIWGGIKYLQSLELSLVRSLCKSRNLLMKLFPSNVQEVRFLAMIEKKHKFHPFVIYMATILYWLLGNCSTRPPKYLRRSKIKEKVPAENASSIGLRSIIAKKEVKKVVLLLKEEGGEIEEDWKLRYQNNMNKIKSGSIYSVAEVCRDFYKHPYKLTC